MGDAQVVSTRAEESGDEGQLVVLHQHGVSRGCRLDDGVGELFTHRDERVPGDTELSVESRFAHQVEEAMVQEPEGLVGDDVVGQSVALGVDRQ